jgi:hypothetical protein
MSIKFKKDWWKRKEEDAYSFYDPSKKLFDWDSGRTGYSSYFVRDNQNLRSAAKMIGSMFRVIGVPKDVKYDHSNKLRAVNDKTTVPVPLSMLRAEDGTYMNHDVELLDAFYGAAIQNAALATLQTKSEYMRTMNARSSQTTTTIRDLMFTILNTERIDKRLADRFPGYSKFVQKFKQYKYDKTYEPLGEEEHAGKRLTETITKFLRYPAHVTEEEVDEFAKPLSQIESYMKKHGFPLTSMDCDKQAQYLSGVINKFIIAEDKKEEEKGDGEGDGDEEGDEEGKGGKAPMPTKSEMNDLAQEMMKKMMNAPDGDDSDEFSDDFDDFTDDMEEKRALPPGHDFSKEGESIDGNVVFKKSDSDKDKYLKDLTKINSTKAQVLAKLFSRKSKDYQFSMKSMRSGRLDTNKLAEAIQRVPTIYERFGQVTTNKINITVLIDESGSMGCGDRMKKARQAAIFINEVFKKQPDVQLYIYGHTADEKNTRDCTIRIYREPGANMDPYALGSATARSNNRDGDAIYAVAKRVRNRTADPGLLFVISDGQPAAYGYNGQASINDTRKKVTMAQALGFQVIQIAIDEEVPSEEMFDYFIKMTNIENLPNDMISYVSKKVDKLIKEKMIF